MNGITVTVVQRHKKEGSQVWYARIRNARTGKVRYVSLKTTRRTEAQLLANEMLREGEFDEKDENGNITVCQGLEKYEKYLRSKGTTEESIAVYRIIFAHLSAFLDIRIQDVQANELLDEFASRFSGFSTNYYNTARTVVKSFFGYFVDIMEIIPRNPARNIPKRKSKLKEKKFWTMEQVAAILDSCTSASYRLLWAFMAYEGLRIHEALKMRRDDIREDGVHIVGKGGKYARIPLSSLMKVELDRVGWEWDFSRLNQSTSAARLLVCAKKTFGDGFDGQATNHRFRHSFASNLVRAGANIKAVQLLMRHSSVTITLNLYSHLMDSDLETGIEKLVENKKNAKTVHSQSESIAIKGIELK